ncbi:MAG: protein-disulfide reductase DsbD family protein [Opitutaceae bacterium]
MKSLRFLILLPTLFTVAASALFAQVQASLVATEQFIQAGKPFTVALRLQHEPHWHTYWLNPGTGLATEITWNLPDGFAAGAIQWPVPKVLRDHTGTIIGNGYEDDLLLPVTITPPAGLKPDTVVTLKARADWLMCKEVCIPGDEELELTLPVYAEEPAVNGELGQRINAVIAELPDMPDEWTATASRGGDTITLRVQPHQAGHTPANLHFFADDDLVGYDLPQTVTANVDGSYTLKLQVSAYGPADATRLVGLLKSDHGWMPDGSLPALRIDVPLTATTAAVAPITAKLGMGTLALALLGGLILNLMPCVFPVLGIKILGFVNQSGSDKRKIVLHGVMFTLGVLVSFWALAGVLLALRAGGAQLGWGFQLQSPGFVFGMAVFFLIFGLNLSGLFEVGLSATGAGATLQTRDGYTGSFFTGLLATLVATPCSAPFLATALPAALALPTASALVVFTFIALGLSAPYLLLSLFPQAIKVLPRPGAWMETFKQFMAFPLYATTGWLLWVLAAQTAGQETALRNILFGLVLVAMAAWIYGRMGQAHGKPGKQRAGVLLALILATGGTWFGWPKSAEAAQAAAAASNAVVWEKWSPEAVAKAQAEGRTIYVDFTARWCFTCQTNKAAVFASDEVLNEFAERNILALKADWTSKDPQITSELAKWNRSAVPFNLLYRAGEPTPIILPEILTPSIVLDALRQ